MKEARRWGRRVEDGGQWALVYDVRLVEREGIAEVGRLPYSIRILLENVLRHLDGETVREEDVIRVARWTPHREDSVELPYFPARVLMQDFTGVPAVVDLAAMRDAMKDLGGDPDGVDPLVPVDLVVDHSIQVDAYGTEHALEINVSREYQRNRERYALLKWAQKSFRRLRVVPPRSGICHQVNLEHLARVLVEESNGMTERVIYPDTVVGTDSHTTMINGLGVLGWGVGGIEAEAVMLGQPYTMSLPDVIGVRLTGTLPPGVTATDLVLRITELLRERNVVEKFVEFFGPGVDILSLPDRATVANMAPEYGATVGYFPIDHTTVAFLRNTGRGEDARRVERFARELGIFRDGSETPEYSDVVEVDLSTVEPSVAGPARPQDRIPLRTLKERFGDILGCRYDAEVSSKDASVYMNESGAPARRLRQCRPLGRRFFDVEIHGRLSRIGDGSVVVAAITSCTNTSNPSVMIGAGLLARNAVKRGLKVPPHVKTSLAPGSRVVMDYLESAGLTPYLQALGFHCVGFGCTTCIGNTGPLPEPVERAVKDHHLNVAAVLSGNRNFEARIHPLIRSNFLASPILVVAFALAGRVDVDFTREPLSLDPGGEPVYLDELWPDAEEIRRLVREHVLDSFFIRQYGKNLQGDDLWKGLPVDESVTFPWDPDSTYIRRPPYFDGFSLDPDPVEDIRGARALLVLGDSVTTDHISPAGAIPAAYPAGRYLLERGIPVEEFNSYGARRGNHEVMVRGTFANVRLRNRLVAGKEGSYTRKFPEGEVMTVYEAAAAYAREGVPLIVLAGSEYGTGSSRDWAAKGTRLLGIRAVIARSFERIHRSNLVGMGVLPLVFREGESVESLGLDGTEEFFIMGLDRLAPRCSLDVEAKRSDGSRITFQVTARLDTDRDVDYFRHGGILPYVLRKLRRGVS